MDKAEIAAEGRRLSEETSSVKVVNLKMPQSLRAEARRLGHAEGLTQRQVLLGLIAAGIRSETGR